MANVQHNTLTSTDLHEPKGVAAAAVDELYLADGAGSGVHEAYSDCVAIDLGTFKHLASGYGASDTSRYTTMPWSGRICGLSFHLNAGNLQNQQFYFYNDTDLIYTINVGSSVLEDEYYMITKNTAGWNATPAALDYLIANQMRLRVTCTNASAPKFIYLSDVTVYMDVGKKTPYSEIS